MKFDEYSHQFVCKNLFETEQSKTFLVERENKTRVCKKFNSSLEKNREEIAQRYILNNNLLNIPKLTEIGEDFLEMEFIKKDREPTLEEMIQNISPLYLKTINNPPFKLFSQSDLSKNKLIHRLSYLREEFTKVNIDEENILLKAKRFVDGEYLNPPQRCLVHGDLKSPHGMPSKNGFKFIDFGLVGISSHWYDLAFLYMEKRDKNHLLETISNLTSEFIDKDLGLSLNETKIFLRSGIFYRCLYNLGYALRHRPKNTIERTKMELNEIMENK